MQTSTQVFSTPLIHRIIFPTFRITFGVLFIFSGGLKILDLAKFQLAVASFGLLPASYVPYFVLAIPCLEIILGLAVALNFKTSMACQVNVLLLGVFTAVLVSALATGVEVSCGCFGSLSTDTIDVMTILRNLILVFWGVALSSYYDPARLLAAKIADGHFMRCALLLVLLWGEWSCTDLGVENDAPWAPSETPIPTDLEPAWSPDAKWVAYVHSSVDLSDTTYRSGLYVIDTSGNNRRLVKAGSILSPDWSPLGDRIAFSAEGMEIMTINPNGGDLFQVTNLGGAFFPSWSPDGRRMVFDTPFNDPRGADMIWIIGADGTALHDISQHGTGEWRDADWSPNGKRIVHYRYIGVGTSEIFVMDSSGNNPTRLTFNNVQDVNPTWSPDGTTIAWTQVETPAPSVSLMDSIGRNSRHLTEGSHPAWSPDSRHIVFSRFSPSHDKTVLWIISADGSDLRQLTR